MDIIRHWLNVKQGSCQVMGSRWNFDYGAKERTTIRQINGGGGWIGWQEVFRRGRLDFWALIEVQRDPLCNVLQEIKF
jgi:hypothetical protein